MKKLVLVFAYLYILNISVVAQHMTQQSAFKLRLYSGLSLPMGDFASVSGEKAGLATTGFLVMMEAVNSISPIVDLTFSLTVAQNGLNAGKIEEDISKVIPGTDVSAGSYYTTWFLTGLQIGPEAYNDMRFYLAGNLGFLFSSFPDISINYGAGTIETESKIAIGFGLGVGVQLDKLNIGFRYLTGTPEYRQKSRASNLGSAELPASVLLVMIGFTF